CLSQKSTLSYYDARADTFRICRLPRQASRVNKIAFDEANNLWLLNGNGELEAWSGKQDQFQLLHTYRQNSAIVNFFPVNHQLFFTTISDGLFAIDNTTRRQRKIMQMEQGISSMIFYKEHYLLGWTAK